MIIIPVSLLANTAKVVPVPCRGTVAKVLATWYTTVTTSNILTIARVSTAVNVVTVTTTTGLVVETGTPDTTNGQLIFDPDASTATYGAMTITPSGGSSVAVDALIFFDDSAYVTEEASEA